MMQRNPLSKPIMPEPTPVTKDGVMVPRELLAGVKSVEIRQEGDRVVLIPVALRSQKSLDEVLELLRSHQEILASQFGIETLGVFGSYARGEQTIDSDVDLLVEFSRPTSLVGLITLQDYLAGLLGLEVDLVTKKGLRAELQADVLADLVMV